MAFATVQLSQGGRRSLGIALTVFSVVQTILGISILGCGLHFILKLEWKTSLLGNNYNSSSLGITILVVGSIVTFLHLCAAKIFYDSGKEETRKRFVYLLFPFVIFFVCLIIVEMAMGISCKVYFDSDIEHFRAGFIKAMQKYSTSVEIKVNVDRLQSYDECCGADNFLDWIEINWVHQDFNPLVNGRLSINQQSVYYPWKVSPPEENTFNYEQEEEEEGISNEKDIDHLKNVVTTTMDISKFDGFPRKPRMIKRRIKRSQETEIDRRQSLLNAINAEKERLLDNDEAGSGYNGVQKEENYERKRTHLRVVPWSCCSVRYTGPCIHDYVTQRYLVTDLHAKDSWNGAGLYKRGCAQVLRKANNTYLKASIILFSMSFVNQIIILLISRYLQTAVEAIELYNREDNSSPGYLLSCTWFGDPNNFNVGKSKTKKKKNGKSKRQNTIENFIPDNSEDIVTEDDDETVQPLLGKPSKFVKKHKMRIQKKLYRKKLQRNDNLNVNNNNDNNDDDDDEDSLPLIKRSITNVIQNEEEEEEMTNDDENDIIHQNGIQSNKYNNHMDAADDDDDDNDANTDDNNLNNYMMMNPHKTTKNRLKKQGKKTGKTKGTKARSKHRIKNKFNHV